MKKAIEVTVTARKADPGSVKADLLAIGFFEKESPAGIKLKLDRKMQGAIASVFKLKDLAERRQQQLFYTALGRSDPSGRCWWDWEKEKRRLWMSCERQPL